MPEHSRQVIGPEAARTLTADLVGLPVSRSWRGYGTALFLELGALRPADSLPSSARDDALPEKGEASVMIQWSWRVERSRSIDVGSWSTDAKIENGIARLAGSTVATITIEGRLPELAIGLSDGRWVRSFMTAAGQPAWTVFLRDGSWLTVERGRIVHDVRSRGTSAGGPAA